MAPDDSNPGDNYPERLGAWAPTGEMPAFPTTRWSLVRDAADKNSVAAHALEIICRDYWYPLYVFARSKGNSPHDAQDLTQGFFEYILRGDRLARADRDKGRLRSYLLGGFKHYMASEWRRETARKRGGGTTSIPIDSAEAESRLGGQLAEPSAAAPDRLFDRFWALEILARVRQRLADEYRAKDRAAQFETLAQFLGWNASGETYSQAGARIGMKAGAVKVAVHRMRKRYGELLRDEIAQTVSSAAEIPDELQTLTAALR